jgi:predicted TIM-barrel fold metal-dependent hydrolase
MSELIETPAHVMDEPPSVVDISPQRFDTRHHLAHAQRQAQERNLSRLFIVDADAHHLEIEAWGDVIKYIEDPVIRHRSEQRGTMGGITPLIGNGPGNQSNANRLLRYPGRRFEDQEPGQSRELSLITREMQSIGLNCQVVFPTSMLGLGLNPDSDMESALSWAYTRYFAEEILPHDSRIKTMVYLPLRDVAQCLRVIETYADHPSVVGFMVTGSRYQPVHHNDFVPIYRALEEVDMPLAFHAGYNPRERLFEGMNKFISVHALGFVLHNMVHLINMIVNGMPERFPRLKVIWIESGLAWLPFIAQRLDNEYLMRTSEAPLLTQMPSEYLRSGNFFYTTQPMETQNLEALEVTMKIIGAESQLLFASDYPHWDFNLPSTVYDLPFLDDKAKANILGENARSLFGLGTRKPVSDMP